MSKKNNSIQTDSKQTNEDYLALVERRKAERAEKGELLSLEMPSGAVWLYYPFSIAQFAVSGKLPVQLLGNLDSIRNGGTKQPSEDELIKAGIAVLEVTREVMLNNLHFPKISLEPKEGCILPEQIDPEDFEYFKNFVMQGAQSARNSFRK